MEEANETNGDEEDKDIMDQYEEEEEYIEKFGLANKYKTGRLPVQAVQGVPTTGKSRAKKKKMLTIVTGK